MGKPIPDSVYKSQAESAAGKGLILSRGPDPNSYSKSQARMAETMCSFLGLP
ncbi:hypothetical protein AUP68_16890 [Ilyonectria robusta]